jgi:hypothetical protein
MVQQVLPPGVQNSDKANLSTQVFGVSTNGTQRLRSGLEQDVVDHLLVLIRDGSDFLGHGKHHMEILYRQQLSLAILQPLCPRQ